MAKIFNKFCGQKFWNNNLTWYTESPELTQCFEKTALVWTAPAFLFIFSPILIVSLFRTKATIEWNYYNKMRQILALPQIIVSISECITVSVKHFQIQSKSVESFASISDIFAAFVRLLSAIIIFIVFWVQIRRGLHTSGVIWMYFLLSVICQLIVLFGHIHSHSTSLYEWILFSFQSILTILLFFCYCFADLLSVQSNPNNDSKAYCPQSSASFLSRLLFSWFTPMAVMGWRKPLTASDLWQIRYSDKSEEIYRKFNKHWISLKGMQNKKIDNSIQTHRNTTIQTSNANDDNKRKNVSAKHQNFKTTKRVGIMRTIIKTFWLNLIQGSIFRLISDILVLSRPQLLKKLLIFMADKNEPEWHGYLYAGLLLLVGVLQVITVNIYFKHMYVNGMRIRTCLVSAIYQKYLRLSNNAKTETTSGEIANLMSTDAPRFNVITTYINEIWSAPFQISLSIYFIWQELGVSILAGLVVLMITILINIYLMSISKRLQTKQMKLKDQRVKAMNEILNGIKVLKLYGWENAFISNILNIRDKELNNLKTIKYFGCVSHCLSFCAPIFISLATFAVYILIDLKHVLIAHKVFVSLVLFNIIRYPLDCFLELIILIQKTSVSVKRLNKFLNSSELSDYVFKYFDKKHAISVQNASFGWVRDNKPKNETNITKTILSDISVQIEKNSFVAIVGSVGSGKSSFLSALLGNMEIQKGFVNISSDQSIAYVPQQAWIQNTSLRNNILFGNNLEEKRYERAIHSCALKPDLNILPGGDGTEMGENGINLSGGQKQRISIARAVYSEANLFLFDDPLSAVDSNVSKHIFKSVFDSKSGLLRDKTRILVTNRLSYLPSTDKIIVLREGVVTETGTYDELIQRDGDFADLIKQYSTNSWNKKEKDLTSVLMNRRNSSITYELNRDKSKLVEPERAETGSVKLGVYYQYFKAMSVLWSFSVFLSYVLMQLFNICTNLWLAEWSDSSIIKEQKTAYYLIIYGLLSLSQVMFLTTGDYALTRGTLKAGERLHSRMLEQIIHSPMAFFDTTPIGRVLNRFVKDVNTCDTTLQPLIRKSIIFGLATISMFTFVSIVIPMFLVVVIPVGIIFYIIGNLYITTSRQLYRLKSITESPIYEHFNQTLSGVETIRAFGVNEKFITELNERLDRNNNCCFLSIIAYRWLSIRLELMANITIFSSALYAVIYRSDLEVSQVGLILTYALNSTQNMMWLVQYTSEFETNIVSVERILEYTDLDREAEWHISETAPKPNWPFEGKISFSNYSTQYRSGLDLCLKRISIDVKPGEKIGIVGRTGAGKSSLILALFRLIEGTEGQILIDGIDIRLIGLHDLRSRLTIIPQDPVLFSGTIRSNLDLFNSYSDEQLWSALELSDLKAFVRTLDSGLEHSVSECGDNLSVGQRQLICLARALLRNTKILILDEATAAVDMETDSLIQTTIRKAFSDCTVLTIAHRLNTILDSDRVLVLNNGRIAEFDSPKALLSDRTSIFYSLAKDAQIVA